MPDILSTLRDSSALVIQQTEDLCWKVQPLGVAEAMRLGVAMALALRHVLPGASEDEDPDIAAALALARDGGDSLKRQVEEAENVVRLVQAAVVALSTDGGASWLPCAVIDQDPAGERYRYTDGTEGPYDEARAGSIERVFVDLSRIDLDTYALIRDAAMRAVGEGAERVRYFRPRPGRGG